ncbi:unnamed protein product [Microthlaspi erraticum]|uniref:Uncharacterized protein n=1 Tax=Microthlaspi erraticum TaxID=1685480 RepID=A0A6D2J9Q3_9BRAS|nr:unnamed protein product [Microthlaspi erraticum]
MKRSYSQKSGDCPDGSIERTAPKPRSPAGRGTHVPRSAKAASVRLKSRPKSKTTRPITHHDPGNSSPRSATPHRHANRARPKRASREVSLAAAQLASRTAHERSVRPGSNASRPAERFHRPNSIRSTTPTDRESVRPRPFRLGHNPIVRPIVPHDRPNAAVDPKPFLKPKLMFSSPA